MQARPETLAGILATPTRFVIPEYQRPYVWTGEEVGQLWDDLWSNYSDSRTASAVDTSSEAYFLGPIVVANRDQGDGCKVSYVVDGQQRLTTLHVLLWIMLHRIRTGTGDNFQERSNQLDRVLTMPSGKSLVKVAGRDECNYQAAMKSSPVDETTALGAVIRYLRSKTKSLSDDDISEFASFLLLKTRFIYVQTDTFASAWELFIGLNGKGKPLSPADLIKAYICGRSSDSGAVADVWENTVVPLGGDATGAILDIVRMSTGTFSTEAGLFDVIEKTWRTGSVDVDVLRIGCEAYHRFWNQPLDTLDLGDSDAIRSLRSLRALRRRDISPVLIALARRYGCSQMFDPLLLQVVDAYQLWMAITCRRGRERDFTVLAHAIRGSDEDYETTRLRVLREIERLAPPKESVRNAVQDAAFAGRVMLHIVKSHEEGLRGDVRIDDVWYEHVMPRTPTPFWQAAAGTSEPNEYSRLVDNIGNITPLDPATNIRGSNSDWSTKRALYLEHVPTWHAAELARQNESAWTPVQIRARAEMIAHWSVNTRWPLRRLLRGVGLQNGSASPKQVQYLVDLGVCRLDAADMSVAEASDRIQSELARRGSV